MFYVTPPLMQDEHIGNSVVCNDGKVEWCFIQLVSGFAAVDLVGLWRNEAHAIIGKRHRGILPTQIRRNWEGRLGVQRGLGVVRRDEGLYVYDEAELRASFRLEPDQWWKSIDPKSLRFSKDLNIGPISISSFVSWVDSLDALAYAGEVVKVRYRRLLKDSDRVLLGICKRTAWAEFPLHGAHDICEALIVAKRV